MKTKLMLIIVALMFLKGHLFAQDYAVTNTSFNKNLPNTSKKLATYDFEVYNYVPEAMKKVTDDMAGNHFLGPEIAKKMYLLDESYTYTELIAPGNPATRTMYKKPVIYNAVVKIDRYIKKCVKTKELTLEEATSKFNKVLDVALNVRSVNTDQFEETIKAQGNNVADVLSLFTEVHLNYTNN